ncbi:hypothetical protein BH11PAT3_BH11PAT3_0840 [soil metagenome]
MEISSTHIDRNGGKVNMIYTESDPLIGLEGKILQGVHAFCFYEDKLVLVKHPLSGWMPPGGGIEPGESYEEAVIREVMEETNMKVLHQKLIGFQDTYEPHRIIRQTRSFCIVEPVGDFISDPDGEITEIKLINPEEYKQYFDWGEKGDRIMQRALELKGRKD